MNETTSPIKLQSLEFNVSQKIYGPMLQARIYTESLIGSYLIIEDRTHITLHKYSDENKRIILPMPFKDKHLRISSGQIIIFETPLDQNLLKKIEEIREGDDLKARIEIEVSWIQLTKENRLEKLERYNWSSPYIYDFATIPKQMWLEQVLNKMGYGMRLFFDIPMDFPTLQAKIQYSLLDELRKRLARSIEELTKARNAYINYDHDTVVDRVREATDSLRDFIKNNKAQLANELLLYTGTCSSNISNILWDDLVKIVDSLFNFGSKGPHAVLRGGTQLIDYRPDVEDAELLFAMMVINLSYIAKKLEKRLVL